MKIKMSIDCEYEEGLEIMKIFGASNHVEIEIETLKKHNAISGDHMLLMEKLRFILKVVSLKTGLEVAKITNKTRKQKVHDARKAYSLLAWKYTTGTLDNIACILNEIKPPDHSTIINNRDRGNDLMETDRDFRYLITECEKQLLENNFKPEIRKYELE